MKATRLDSAQLSSIRPGEVLTIAAVMAVFTIVILTVVAFQLFSSKSAKVTMPDGYSFEWKSVLKV